MTKKHKKTTEEAVNENATLSRRAATIGGIALLTGGAAGVHSLLSGHSEDEIREISRGEIERTFNQIRVSDLDYEMVETGLEYVENRLGSEYAEEIISNRQFELWGESDDVSYVEGEITWNLNENRESIARHLRNRDDWTDPEWTGRYNTRFETAKTFIEGIDRGYERPILRDHSDKEVNEADLEHLEDIGYDEGALEKYGE